MPASKGRYKCSKCPFTTNFSNQYQIHLNQCQPVNRVEPQTEWYCELCNVPTTSKETHKSHLEGAKHRKKAVEAAHMKRVILLTQEDTHISNLPKKLPPETLRSFAGFDAQVSKSQGKEDVLLPSTSKEDTGTQSTSADQQSKPKKKTRLPVIDDLEFEDPKLPVRKDIGVQNNYSGAQTERLSQPFRDYTTEGLKQFRLGSPRPETASSASKQANTELDLDELLGSLLPPEGVGSTATTEVQATASSDDPGSPKGGGRTLRRPGLSQGGDKAGPSSDGFTGSPHHPGSPHTAKRSLPGETPPNKLALKAAVSQSWSKDKESKTQALPLAQPGPSKSRLTAGQLASSRLLAAAVQSIKQPSQGSVDKKPRLQRPRPPEMPKPASLHQNKEVPQNMWFSVPAQNGPHQRESSSGKDTTSRVPFEGKAKGYEDLFPALNGSASQRLPAEETSKDAPPHSLQAQLAAESSTLDTLPESILRLLECPISMEVMQDPVMMEDGYTYNRAHIEHWLETNDSSPMTGLKLPSKRLMPNIYVKSLIARFDL